MGLPFEKQSELYNACDPEAPLAPSDPRRADLDAHRARGNEWTSRLAKSFELSRRPITTFFSGLRGSGKSTQLLLLKERLERGGFRVVYIRAEETIDLASKIDAPDVLLSIYAAVARDVAALEQRDPEDALKTGLFQRVWQWLSTTDIVLKDADLKLAPVPGMEASLALEMRHNPSFRQKVRDTLATRFSAFLGDLDAELERLDALVKRTHPRGLLVMFDSLEKLRGLTSNWQDVIRSAERLFAGGAPYLSERPIHLLCTVPPMLLLRQAIDVEFLPMIKLRDTKGARHEPGYLTAREIIARRIPEDDRAALFGPHHVACVDKIIEWSGGYPREIVRVLQEVVSQDEAPLSVAALDTILLRMGEDYRRVVATREAQWLAQVSATGKLPYENEDALVIADHALQNSLIFRYLNSTEWYDIHPALKLLDSVRAAKP